MTDLDDAEMGRRPGQRLWPALSARRARVKRDDQDDLERDRAEKGATGINGLLPTSLVGSYEQQEWLIDRKRLASRFPLRVRSRVVVRGA